MGEFEVDDGSTSGTHEVMMMAGQPLGWLVPGYPVWPMVGADQACLTEYGQGSVEGGEGNRVQRPCEVCCRHRSRCFEQGFQHPPTGGSQPNAMHGETLHHSMIEIGHYRSIMIIVLIMKTRLLCLLLTTVVVLGACSSDETAKGFTVVVTTSVWADVVEELDVDDEWTVEVLMPRGVDPHDFAPSAAQVAAIYGADLVVANGLGLEEGLEDALLAAEAEGVPILFLAPLLDPLPFDGSESHDEEEHAADEDDHGEFDPHVWLDPVRVGEAAVLIGDRVSELIGDDAVQAAAFEFAEEMDLLVEEMDLILAGVEDRRLVTNHDALGYFADRFGFQVVGTVIPGGTTVAEPSSREIADLITRIRSEGITAIFVDEGVASPVAEAIVDEFGGSVAMVELNTGSLTTEGEASTLVGLLRSNALLIADALGSA